RQLDQRPDLFGELLAQPDDVLARGPIVELALFAFLVVDQEIHTVESQPAVIADDPPAAVGIRQTGDDVRTARLSDLRRVGVEHAVVVRLAVLGEDLPETRVRGVAVRPEARFDDAPASERHDRALERRIGLEADDDLVFLVDVTRTVREDAGRRLRHVEHALFALLREQRKQRLPEVPGTARRALQERAVSFVRSVVALNEVANVHAPLPHAGREPAPRDLRLLYLVLQSDGHLGLRSVVCRLTAAHALGSRRGAAGGGGVSILSFSAVARR